jgi:hypothetical protein
MFGVLGSIPSTEVKKSLKKYKEDVHTLYAYGTFFVRGLSMLRFVFLRGWWCGSMLEHLLVSVRL